MVVLRRLLKVILLPVSLLLLLIKAVLRIAEKMSSYAVGLLVLIIVFGLGYSVFTQTWTNLLIFAIIGGALVAIMFLNVLIQETCDSLREHIGNL